jgi:hypothetical protein
MSQRLRYPEEHWSRLEDPALDLGQYLDMYSDAYNSTKAVLYMRLIGDGVALQAARVEFRPGHDPKAGRAMNRGRKNAPLSGAT